MCTRLGELEPHGEANPQPVFVSHGVNVVPDSVRMVGKEGQHLKFRAYGQGSTSEWDAIAFRMGELAGGLTGRVDLATVVEMNDYSGRPQLTVKDCKRLSGLPQDTEGSGGRREHTLNDVLQMTQASRWARMSASAAGRADLRRRRH